MGNMFRHLFHQYGCQIEVFHESGNEKLDSEEIFEEIITLIHCFSMRHYSRRRLNRIRQVFENEENGKDKDKKSDTGAVQSSA
jgi:putative resolvase